MEPYVGQIQAFGFNFAPRGWALCEGQLLAVSQNEALFSLLGTIYGGDGRTTFGLPDLRGRISLCFGQGPGLSSYRLGQKGGEERETLTVQQMPQHNHTANVSAEAPNQNKPGSGVIATPSPTIYSSATPPDATLKSSTIGMNGGSQSHENMQPYLTINWSIALVGIYPSRN